MLCSVRRAIRSKLTIDRPFGGDLKEGKIEKIEPKIGGGVRTERRATHTNARLRSSTISTARSSSLASFTIR